MGLGLFKKKEKNRGEEEVVEETKDDAEIKDNEINENVKQNYEDPAIKMNERLNDIENKLPRIDISISNLKKDIDSIRNDIRKIEDSMKDMMALYEVVSAQINPFVGSSKATKLSFEKIDEIERKFLELEETLIDIQMDMRIIYRNTLNLREIINEVLYGEVISLE